MSHDEAFKIIEITGASDNGQDAAIQAAISRASETLHKLRWFEVIESRGAITDGRVSQYQVTLKVGFHLEE